MSEESSKGHDADKSEAGRQSYPPQKKAGSVNKSRAIALRVSTNSVWFLQHCQLIQFMMRESIRGKQEKKSKKLPRKSIQ